MNDFHFHNPCEVFFGKNQIDAHLGEQLARFGSRVLMVYGGNVIKKTGLYDRLTGLMEAAGLTVFEYDGVEPNPRHTSVNAAARIARENDIDVLLAIGGGSAIDCSKGIAALAYADTDDVWDLVERKVGFARALPIVTVVTIASTGSEMDASAVISNIDKNVKSGIASPLIRPAVTFEDPTLTLTVPRFQTACGGFDIMCHVMDVRYFTQQDQMDMLLRMSEELMVTVRKHLPVVLETPDDYDSRANLMWAASWALNSFLTSGVSQPTVCHAIEHELSAYYDITHGLGLAIVVPRWMAYVLAQDTEATAPRIARFGERVMGVEPTGDVVADAKAAIAALEEFCYGTLGLESHLSALGIGEENFEAMATSACRGGTLKAFTELTPADVVEIYRMCL